MSYTAFMDRGVDTDNISLVNVIWHFIDLFRNDVSLCKLFDDIMLQTLGIIDTKRQIIFKKNNAIRATKNPLVESVMKVKMQLKLKKM